MSESYALLIVGGGPAGLSAARAYRDAGGDGPVAIVTDEYRMPYQRPPLTKELLRGEVGEDELALESEPWLDAHGVLLIAGRATALDPDPRRVTLSGGRSLHYESCLLATGAEPKRLPIPGADDPSVRVVRTLDHVRELLVRLDVGDPVVVIGSGFIGCEIAASLALRGQTVTLVSDEATPNQRRLGPAAGARIAGWLERLGVRLMLGAEVDRIGRRDDELYLRRGPQHLRAPTMVMAAGVAPRSELLGGDEPRVDGAIPVDVSMRTALPRILAAGDVAFAENATAGRALRVEHWGDALGQGEVAGRTAAGEAARWADVPGFWSTIGHHTLKYAAWGDGYERARFVPGGTEGVFTVWYERGGQVVGVLTHEADEDYARGRDLIAVGATCPTS
jgi:3-phenylpropionate/trans-cinnamate dioxygenase ferredoxin reductase component